MSADHKPVILVIDDEKQIRKLLRVSLESAGFNVREAETGGLGLSEAAASPPDAAVIDLGLPDLDGKVVLRRLREWSKMPVLILTVRNAEKETIAALDLGADDYMTKPFRALELVARVKALLRRSAPAENEATISVGDVEIDLRAHLVRRAGAELKLTAKEYDLLKYLALRRGRVVTHGQILREIWGPNAEGHSHYLWVYMKRLREKLEADPHVPTLLITEAGIGYRFVGDPG